MYKLIVCDLDDTLLNSEKNICIENILAIQKAQEIGIKFIPATGRGYTSIDYILKKLNLYDMKNEYTISNNGAIVTENKNYHHIFFHGLPYYVAELIVRFGLEKHLCVQVFTEKDTYVFNINPGEKEWLKLFKPDTIFCKDDNIDFLRQTEIVKVMYQNTDIIYLSTLSDSLSETIKKHTIISYSSNRYMEFNASGISKGSALITLSEMLNIKSCEIIAIGTPSAMIPLLSA